MTDEASKLSMPSLGWRGRLTELVAGMAAMKVTNLAFDYVLYPVIIYHFGILLGGIVMTAFAFLACLATVLFYDWSKRDWLGIESVRSLREYGGCNRVGRVTSWILNRSKPFIFMFLSLKFDAFVTMVYFRHDSYGGMSKRDWRIFSGSILISNAYWTFACYMGISLFEYGTKVVRQYLYFI